MRYRSRHTVEAYYRDGTPEADSAIIQAVDGAELMTDSLGDTHLYVPAMFGKHAEPRGDAAGPSTRPSQSALLGQRYPSPPTQPPPSTA